MLKIKGLDLDKRMNYTTLEQKNYEWKIRFRRRIEERYDSKSILVHQKKP